MYVTFLDVLEIGHVHNETQKLPYLWTKDKPLFYVQQIILKTGKQTL